MCKEKGLRQVYGVVAVRVLGVEQLGIVSEDEVFGLGCPLGIAAAVSAPHRFDLFRSLVVAPWW